MSDKKEIIEEEFIEVTEEIDVNEGRAREEKLKINMPFKKALEKVAKAKIKR